MAGEYSRHAWFVTLDFHDDAFSRDIVLINVDNIAGCALAPGSLARLSPVASSKGESYQRQASGHTVNSDHKSQHGDRLDEAESEGAKQGKSPKRQKDSRDGNDDDQYLPEFGDHLRTLVFRISPPTQEQLAKKPKMQVSVHSSAKYSFDLANRQRAIVFPSKPDRANASFVELAFRDQYLSRSDLWQLVVSELVGKTAFKGQQILYMGSVKARVKNIFQDGHKLSSAMVTSNTLPIFRSESARYVFFVQMSREMWEYDAEGSGEIMFNKVINGFLPDLFKQWQRAAVKHLVTIIMFSRIEYEKGILKHKEGHSSTLTSSEEDVRKDYRDYYRVVTTETPSADWINILYFLKKEFKTFLRDILILPADEAYGRLPDTLADFKDSSVTDCVIAGRPTVAAKGNVLEAINLASYQFAQDNVDRDLVRTGISLVIVTPGTGVFEVNYKVLRLVTETLVGNGIGIDLVALSPMPLHSVPLFKYKSPRTAQDSLHATAYGSLDAANSTPRSEFLGKSSSLSPLKTFKQRPNGSGTPEQAPTPLEPAEVEWSYALPHWIDVSFWSGDTSESNWHAGGARSRGKPLYTASTFQSSCRMYELQMMGLMDIEVADIAIAHLGYPLTFRDVDSIPGTEADPRSAADSQIPSRTRAQTGSSRETADDEEEETKNALSSWMSRYDQDAFAIDFKPHLPSDGSKSRNRPLDTAPVPIDAPGMVTQHLLPDNSALMTSTNTKMDSPHDISQSRNRTMSMVSNSDSLSIRSGKMDPMSLLAKSGPRPQQTKRQFSIGVKGVGSAKAAASTGLTSVATDTVSGDMRSLASPAKPTSLLAQQLRASLRRKPSGLASDGPSDSSSKSVSDAESHSEPIKIKRDVAGTSSDEDEALAGATLRPQKGFQVDLLSTTVRPPDHMKMAQHLRALRARRPDDRTGQSPLSAVSPWLTLLNPSNPRRENMSTASHYRRWQHVFPRALSTSKIKWKSLTSPATLPLTNEAFPTPEEIREEYEEVAYHVEAPYPEDVSIHLPNEKALLRQLIAVRLSHGFQIVIGEEAEAYARSHGFKLIDCFDPNFVLEANATVLLSIGNDYHQLECHSPQRFFVRRFLKKVASSLDAAPGTKVDYRPRIRCKMAEMYRPRRFILQNPRSRYNWSMIDEHSSGLRDELSSDLIFWRTRFVLVPTEIPRTGRGPLAAVTEVSDEETRIEGIQRLTQLWQRHRYIPPDERRQLATSKLGRELKPLAIDYHTRDTSAVVHTFAAGQLDSLIHNEDRTTTFAETAAYYSGDFDLQRIAQHVQAKPPKGVLLVDRRWHWRLFHRCFRGDDFTTWLMANFKDINTREEAVVLGNEMMSHGLFTHVQSKHQFRDGNYFYQVAGEYRVPSTPDPRPGWFSRMTDRSIPNTPTVESNKSVAFSERPISRHSRDESTSGSSSGDRTPTKIKALELSQVLQYDVDPRKRSWRPEIINLHYDRVHNPENCFHIRIDWINVTSKLIDDAVTTWASTAERYGLKFIEVPISEACTITDLNPFRANYRVELVLKPPIIPQKHAHDATPYPSISTEDPLFYHKSLLRKWDFVLDMEASRYFDGPVSVMYSWGKPDYKYTQFVHKSGSTIVEIDDDGVFIFFANRRHGRTTATSNSRTEAQTVPASDRHRALASPHASPLFRPADIPSSPRPMGNLAHRGATPAAGTRRDASGPAALASTNRAGPQSSTAFTDARLSGKPPTAENIKSAFERFCASRSELEALWEEVSQRLLASASPSPRQTPADSIAGGAGNAHAHAHAPTVRPGNGSSPRSSPRVTPALRGIFGVGPTTPLSAAAREREREAGRLGLGAVEDIPSLGLPERRMQLGGGAGLRAASYAMGSGLSVANGGGGSGSGGGSGGGGNGIESADGTTSGNGLGKPSSPRDLLEQSRRASHIG